MVVCLKLFFGFLLGVLKIVIVRVLKILDYGDVLAECFGCVGRQFQITGRTTLELLKMLF
jgi:hypothetical protein